MLPLEFTVSVRAQRENRFTVAAHNELVFKLVQLGMVTPEIGLELMLFDGKREAQALMREKKEQAETAKAAQAGTSVPGASTPGASTPGTSMPGASMPGASTPGASAPAAHSAQLPAAALSGLRMPVPGR